MPTLLQASKRVVCWAQTALPRECRWRGIPRVPFLCRWANLRDICSAHTRKCAIDDCLPAVVLHMAYTQHMNMNTVMACCRHMGLGRSVKAAGIIWEGRAHSGLVDARNTARLAAHLIWQAWPASATGLGRVCLSMLDRTHMSGAHVCRESLSRRQAK